MFQEKIFKKRRLKRSFRKDIEPHEILLDHLSKKREEEGIEHQRRMEVPLLRKVLQLFLFFSILAIFLLFLKTFQLQIIEGDYFLARADENKFIIHKIQAERGIIYDRNFKQLVFNLPSFRLICRKDYLPESATEKERVFREVSRVLEINYQ